MNYQNDPRVVMTLDAGGTNFVFGAIRGCQEVVEPIHLPSAANNLELSLQNMINGFHAVRSKLTEKPVAISFAFPGPADYPQGIIWNMGNLPAYKGGVAVGPMLAAEFGIPVFINNDGDLYAYGEAISGFLPWVNQQLAAAGSPKRYQNLVGLTLGTGFGGGLVRGGQLFQGDNSAGMEVWLLSQRYHQQQNIEECISIRAVRRVYGELTGTAADKLPNPKEIYEIGIGENAAGDKAAALEAFRQMGQALGDALCNILTMTDGVAVIGGGVAGARSLFVPAMLEEMQSHFTAPSGATFPRLAQKAFYLDDEQQLEQFLQGEVKQLQIPHTHERVTYDSMARVGIGFSKIGTSKAIWIGAYAYALSKLDSK